jgi:hypothetical protein
MVVTRGMEIKRTIDNMGMNMGVPLVRSDMAKVGALGERGIFVRNLVSLQIGTATSSGQFLSSCKRLAKSPASRQGEKTNMRMLTGKSRELDVAKEKGSMAS